MTVSDSSEVVVAAAAGLTMQTVNLSRAKLPGLPDAFLLDEKYAPVPITNGSMEQAMSIAKSTLTSSSFPPSTGSQSFVVRGIIEPADLPIIYHRARDTGTSLVFSDPAIQFHHQPPICMSTHFVGTDADVRRLLGIGRLRDLGMLGHGVAIAIVDSGINLEFLRKRGLSPRMDMHASWSPRATIPGRRSSERPRFNDCL